MSAIIPSRRSTSRSANSAPILESQRSTSGPLPRPLTTFVGRDRELATVVELILRPDVRLLKLTGAGGVGKTRLALSAAEAARNAFEDGAVFVSLAPVRDPTMLLPTVAQTLNVPDAPDQPLMSRLRTFLSDKNMLLVLDNAEHLLDAMPVVVDLLAASPRLAVLVTSRMSVNVSGEHLVPVEPLSAEEARTLFVERVRAFAPDFALTGELVPVVDTICARLDRLPLAIELAASRVPSLPPRAILARLEHRLDLLTNGPRDVPARLRAMRDAIGWSHDLLPDDQQILFRRLGVFIGGFTLEAAQVVAGNAVDALDGVSALVAANLVVPMKGVADDPRYTMLETIREYALERLAASGEEANVRARHADYYRSLAEDALPLYDGPQLRIATDRVDIELDNCRAAMTWALATNEAETGTRLAGALWRVWWYVQVIDGRPLMERAAEGRSWIDRMLAMRDGLPVEAVTEALVGAGMLAYFQGNLDRTQVYGEELLARVRAEAYPWGKFWAVIATQVITENLVGVSRALCGQKVTSFAFTLASYRSLNARECTHDQR